MLNKQHLIFPIFCRAAVTASVCVCVCANVCAFECVLCVHLSCSWRPGCMTAPWPKGTDLCIQFALDINHWAPILIKTHSCRWEVILIPFRLMARSCDCTETYKRLAWSADCKAFCVCLCVFEHLCLLLSMLEWHMMSYDAAVYVGSPSLANTSVLTSRN